jgi:hypothetical protein
MDDRKTTYNDLIWSRDCKNIKTQTYEINIKEIAGYTETSSKRFFYIIRQNNSNTLDQ